MRVIAIKTIKTFWEKTGCGDSEEHLKAWYLEVKKATWQNPNEIKAKYRSASVVGNNRVVFNICGNKYRLIVAINYAAQIIYIRFIGTHVEYDKIDATTV
ncbi:MAG: type II toxin-antitoxin system HigB family toxin [Flavobacteriales bacterium]|nr:type II toxin-antitoxin system HigB family toxin [Flavobacteriales bacterium]